MRLRDTSTPVVVLRTVEDHGSHAGLGIARSLGRLRVPVFWVDPDPSVPAARSRYVHRTFRLIHDPDRPGHATDRLLAIGRELGQRAILIPTDDAGCVLIADEADALRERFIFPRQSPELVRRLADKHAMYGLCCELGIPAPASLYAESREEVLGFVESSPLPVVLKPARGWSSGSLKSIVIARTADEALRTYDEASASGQSNLLLQEYIPGPPDSVWMFNGYFDERSDCRIGLTGHKIRQNPPYTGLTTLGVCRTNETVTSQTAKLAKALGYQGIIDIGYRYDARDSSYKLLDVNPRIGATFRLFVTDDGGDVVRAMYSDLTGQEFQSTSARDGRKWVVENLDLISSVAYLRNRDISAWPWLLSFRGIAEAAWWAADDLAPFRRMGRQFIAKPIRRLRKSHSSVELREHQKHVDEHFAGDSHFWHEIYEGSDVYAVIHQERRMRALSWIAQLGLPPQGRVLDAGCGAGATAIALAQKGYDVKAIDTVPEMVELTRRLAVESGADLEVDIGDAHALSFEDNTFDLVLALGVIPWLHSPGRALREFARVSKPDAHLIVNADNCLRLTHLLDPTFSPVLKTVRAWWRRLLRRQSPPALPVTMHEPEVFNRLLAEAGFDVMEAVTLGFGPFTFRWRRLPDRINLPLHHALQRLGDRGAPLVRRRGEQYLVLARPHGRA